MAMVEIGVVRVFVGKSMMPVPVSMRLARLNAGLVFVFMFVVFVVDMLMLMLDFVVSMLVFVLFGEVQVNAGGHAGGRAHELRSQRLMKEQ